MSEPHEVACVGCDALPAEEHRRDCPVYLANLRREGDQLRRMEDLGLAYQHILKDATGRDEEGTAETPGRAARAWCELTRGYHEDPPHLKTFEARHDELVVVAPISFFSLCEHHILPFHGRAYIAYIPQGRVVGLSKFARVVDHFARRLQVQERLTTEIADYLQAGIRGPCICDNRSGQGGHTPACAAGKPKGIAVVLKAEHLCMSMRGAQVPGAITTTSVMRGAFRDQPESRAEVLGLMGLNGK